MPTTIIGGGSDFLEIDDVSDPSTVTVNAGSENNYAGIAGGTITYNYTSDAREDKLAFNVNENFTVNSKIVAVFDNPLSYDERNLLTFKVASGKTLTLYRIEVVYPENEPDNYISFSGGNIILNSSKDISYTALLHYDRTNFTNRESITAIASKFNAATLNLGGNYNVTTNAYLGSGGATSINLNGYDFTVSNNFNIEVDDAIINVTFGSDANGDGVVIYAAGALNQKFATSTTIFKDFDYTKDLILLKNPISDLSIFEFEGYEGQEILSKVLTAEDTIELQIDSSYAGYTSYYVIPEPSIFAALLGFISLAVVARRKK